MLLAKLLMNKITLSFLFFFWGSFLVAQNAPSHTLFDALLQKYVDEAGMVNYRGLQANRSILKDYLKVLKTNPPLDTWSENEKLAFWINAYNAFTLDLVLEYYPVNSIRDLGSTIKIPLVSTAWDVKFIHIGDRKYDLNHIEHGIIRKEFDEPRIHFALVCAAVSCPKLENNAYLPETLEEQLANATRFFLADTNKNVFMNAKKAELSKIFDWYGGDFNDNGALVDFLNKYAPLQLESDAKVSWMNYNWALNEQ